MSDETQDKIDNWILYFCIGGAALFPVWCVYLLFYGTPEWWPT